MRNNFLGLLLAVFASTFYPLPSQSMIQSSEQPLSRKVNSFQLADSSLSIALQRLAKTSHLLVGFDSLPETDTQPASTFSVNVQDGTVREVLDALTNSDPRYIWTTSGQMIDVHPAKGRDTLSQIVIRHFKVDLVTRDQALEALVRSPEIQAELRQKRIKRREFNSFPGDLAAENLPRFSLDLRDLTMREILNAIAKASDSTFWVLVKYGDQNQYLSVKMT